MVTVKNAWRLHLKERLRGLTKGQVGNYSQSICERIELSPYWEHSRVVALFAGMPSEAQLQSLVERAHRQGKRILYPKIDVPSSTLTFYSINNLCELQKGAWGILEPGLGASLFSTPFEIDLICVPGLGFDRRGVRLGRGKGYYDRFLASLSPETIKLGVFFSAQELKEVPEMSHDIRMNGIVTEQELILL